MLLPFQGVIYTYVLVPRALPWADSYLPLRGVDFVDLRFQATANHILLKMPMVRKVQVMMKYFYRTAIKKVQAFDEEDNTYWETNHHLSRTEVLACVDRHIQERRSTPYRGNANAL